MYIVITPDIADKTLYIDSSKNNVDIILSQQDSVGRELIIKDINHESSYDINIWYKKGDYCGTIPTAGGSVILQYKNKWVIEHEFNGNKQL